MRLIRFLAMLALLSILVSFSAFAQTQRPLVIRGGLLIDGTGAAPVPNSVIVVSNGRIQAVGREGTVTIPANATIIEAAHKFAPIIQKMVANKMFLNPTVAAQFERASKYLPEFDRINTDYVNSPMALGLPKAVRDRYGRWLKPGPEQNSAQLAEGYKRAGLFIKQFAESGGKLIAGTDSDAGRLGTSGITLHEEMAMFSEIGVPPMKIIQYATSWGMEAWGI